MCTKKILSLVFALPLVAFAITSTPVYAENKDNSEQENTPLFDKKQKRPDAEEQPQEKIEDRLGESKKRKKGISVSVKEWPDTKDKKEKASSKEKQAPRNDKLSPEVRDMIRKLKDEGVDSIHRSGKVYYVNIKDNEGNGKRWDITSLLTESQIKKLDAIMEENDSSSVKISIEDNNIIVSNNEDDSSSLSISSFAVQLFVLFIFLLFIVKVIAH